MLSVKRFHSAPFVRVFPHSHGTFAVADTPLKAFEPPTVGGVVLSKVILVKSEQPENA